MLKVFGIGFSLTWPLFVLWFVDYLIYLIHVERMFVGYLRAVKRANENFVNAMKLAEARESDDRITQEYNEFHQRNVGRLWEESDEDETI